MTSSQGAGIFADGNPRHEQHTSVLLVDSKSTGHQAGVAVSGSAKLEAANSLISSTSESGTGVLLGSGSVTLSEKSIAEGQRAGAVLGRFDRISVGPGELTVDGGSTVRSPSGPAVLVTGDEAGSHLYQVTVRDGGSLSGGNGVAVDVQDRATFLLNIERASVNGDVLISEASKSTVRLGRDGHLSGSIVGADAMKVGRAAVWSLTGDSKVRSLDLDGGTVAFAASRKGPARLRISSDLGGVIGDVVVNVHMDPRDVRKSWTDSLLVEGNVDVEHPIDVNVKFTGTSHGTDVNGDGVSSGVEGFSIVQVGGSSRPDAFRLRDDYVTHGAFQYELKAFHGNEVSAKSSLLEGGKAQWDYRLVERMVCRSGCDDGGGSSGDHERPAVSPQIPSYISAPAAAFAYADGMTTSLHERLGEIRDHAFEGSIGGEIFARYSGRSQRYSTDRSFKSYGYDFDERVEAWQFGGSIIGLDGDNGSLRAGLAIDHGRSSIVPRAADGDSITRLRANGTSAWITWRSGDGFWIDSVVGQQRMRGTTDTSLGGRAVGRIEASATGVSLATGYPIRLGSEWSLEPHILLSGQSVRFAPIREASGMSVDISRNQYVTRSAGLSFLSHSEVMAPFVRVDLRSTKGRGVVRTAIDASTTSADFSGGGLGAEYVVSSGLTTQLSPRIQLFGGGAYRHFIGRGGFQGWSGNLGLRMTL
ncbi:autotransporter outer membrane beta-barrel domain-containing protein [Luteibacter sp.]|uniref:autotransporter outer membrane beta-barrel domain-containing protein n=1 Tax=Luteibacter sp. TaxID=1886636 RepID=UPI003F7DC0C8